MADKVTESLMWLIGIGLPIVMFGSALIFLLLDRVLLGRSNDKRHHMIDTWRWKLSASIGRKSYWLFLACSTIFVLGLVELVATGVFGVVSSLALPLLRSPALILGALPLGLVLFWVKGRLPVTYGLAEIFVAIGSLSASQGGDVKEPFLRLLGAIAAVYIFVRGLENIERGLPSEWYNSWLKTFPKVQRNSGSK
jgi:hypothetical protein